MQSLLQMMLLLASMATWPMNPEIPEVPEIPENPEIPEILETPGNPADSAKVNQLKLGLAFMTHGETCGGGLPKTDNKSQEEERSHFLLGRTQFIVDYERQWPQLSMPPSIQVHAIIQNKSVWGSNGNQSLALYEGWVKMTAKNGLFAQIGRVALAYDDERIIGPNDFAIASKTHDVARLGYEGQHHQLHAILAYNQNAQNVYSDTYYDNGAQPYKTMQTLWYHYDIPKFPLGASFLFMNVGMQAGKNDPTAWDYNTNSPRTEYQQIFGTYLKFHPKRLTIEGSYYRQTGKQVNQKKSASDIRAWMASFKATITPATTYSFTLGYDHLSGDDFVPDLYGGRLGMPNHDVYRGFTPLYGSSKKFYGIMDYFYQSAYSHGFTPGLQNVFLTINLLPTPKFRCALSYHYLAVSTKISDLNRTLGHSCDILASYRFTKDISLSAGYTLMFGTDTMDRLKQGNSSKQARWGWFTFNLSPTLFTSKW